MQCNAMICNFCLAFPGYVSNFLAKFKEKELIHLFASVTGNMLHVYSVLLLFGRYPMMNVGMNPFIGQQVSCYQQLISHYCISVFTLNTGMRN